MNANAIESNVDLASVSTDADNAWRALALQFDQHRMQALAVIRLMVSGEDGAMDTAKQFLKAAPVPGEEVLRSRLTEMQSNTSPKEAAECLMTYLKEIQEAYVWEAISDAMDKPLADPGDVFFAGLRALMEPDKCPE